MNKRKQVTIHCGFHKTASSSIQNTLGYNRKNLKEMGYYYPDMMVDGNRFYNQSIPVYGFFTEHPENFQHYTRHNNFDARQVNQSVNNLLQNDVAKYDNVLLSDEFISGLSKEGLTKLKNRFESMGFKVRVIAFIREPYSLAISRVQQRIGNKKHIQGLLNNFDKINKDSKKIKLLIDIFGSSIEFHCFEKTKQFTGGPVAYFLNLLEIEQRQRESIVLKFVNESKSQQTVRLISYINQNWSSYVDENDLSVTREQGDIYPLYEIKGEKFTLTAQELNQIEPAILKERTAILVLLGNDFFMPASYTLSERNVAWSEQQITVLIATIPRLKAHIAVLAYEYFRQVYLQNNAITLEQLDSIGYCVINNFSKMKDAISFPSKVTEKKRSKFKKVILHVGPDKTGTTSIQMVLNKCRVPLLEQDIFYPSGERHHIFGSCMTSKDDLFVYNMGFNREQHLQEILTRDKEYLESLKNELSKNQVDTLILSCEGFVSLSVAAFERMKQFLEHYCETIEVVFYVRPPLSYAASSMSQRVKTGKRIWEGMPSPIVPYQDYLEKLSRVFGKSQINLRLFAKDVLPKGNVVLDFLSLLGLPMTVQEQLVSTMPSQNHSLSEEALLIGDRMIAILNGFVPAGAEFRKRRGIGDKFLPMIKGRTIQLTDLQQEVVLKHAMPHFNYLRSEFGFSLGDEHYTPYESRGISVDTIDFAAKVLLNIVVPDFEQSTAKANKKITEEEKLFIEEELNPAIKEITAGKKVSKFKKVILHVGPDKTGSTSIQTTLNNSRELLLEHGVLYGPNRRQPIFGSCFSPEPELYVYNKSRYRNKTRQECRDRDEEYLLSFRKVLSQVQADVLVLSYEGFIHLTELALEKMKQFLEDYCETCEVVLYVRPPLSYAASALSQRVKTGKRAWLSDPPILRYQEFGEKLCRVFGKNNVNLRPFARELFPNGNVVLDFLSILNLPTTVQEQIVNTMPSENNSLTEEALVIGDRMVVILNGYVPSGPEFKNRSGIGIKFLPMIKGRKIQLTYTQQETVLEHAKPHTVYLENEFGMTFTDKLTLHKPLNVSADTIDFTAKVLLNILMPDFKIEAISNQEKHISIPNYVSRLKFKVRVKGYFWLIAMKVKKLLVPYPKCRFYIKKLLVRFGMY